MTTLHEAVETGTTEEVKAFLTAGTAIDSRNDESLTSLMIACSYDKQQVVEMLLNYRADPNLFDDVNRSALMFACYNGHPEIVRLLLQADAEKNSKCSEGKTALMYATQCRHEEIVQILIEDGADIEVLDNNDMSALDYAKSDGLATIVKILENPSFTKVMPVAEDSYGMVSNENPSVGLTTFDVQGGDRFLENLSYDDSSSSDEDSDEDE